jgi:electron transfer flavoprotein alpha subunit
MSENTDLDQIRPAYGGNIMAHINTPRHRPQFATVRYKIFQFPPKSEPRGKIVRRTLPPEKLASKIEILGRTPKSAEKSIEEAEVLVVCGRGVRRREDVAMLEELAGELGGMVAATRAVVEAGWLDAKRQIGLSGRTVKPKLIITCGVSGAIQFVAGMSGAETIVAINSDPKASIFKVAHVGLVGDLYAIVPELTARIRAKRGLPR